MVRRFVLLSVVLLAAASTASAAVLSFGGRATVRSGAPVVSTRQALQRQALRFLATHPLGTRTGPSALAGSPGRADAVPGRTCLIAGGGCALHPCALFARASRMPAAVAIDSVASVPNIQVSTGPSGARGRCRGGGGGPPQPLTVALRERAG
jgi:hypothetical protein